MEEYELKNIWKQSSLKGEIKINESQLMNDFKKRMKSREHIVRRRDLRETIGALVGIALFSYALIILPFSIASIGAIMMISSLSYTIYQLYDNRKSRFTQDLFLPINEQLNQQKKFMLHQMRLLDTVFYWMILPFFLSYMVFIWGSYGLDIQEGALMEYVTLGKLSSKIVVSLFILGYSIYVVRLNKKAVEVNWKPLVNDIDQIIQALNKEK